MSAETVMSVCMKDDLKRLVIIDASAEDETREFLALGPNHVRSERNNDGAIALASASRSSQPHFPPRSTVDFYSVEPEASR